MIPIFDEREMYGPGGDGLVAIATRDECRRMLFRWRWKPDGPSRFKRFQFFGYDINGDIVEAVVGPQYD